MTHLRARVVAAVLLFVLAASLATADAPAEWTPPIQIAVAPVADANDKCSEALLAAFSKELGASGYRFLPSEKTAALAEEPTAEKLSPPLVKAHPWCEVLALLTATEGELQKEPDNSSPMLPRTRYSLTINVALVLHDPLSNKAFDRIEFGRTAKGYLHSDDDTAKNLELLRLSLASSARLEVARYAVSRVEHLCPAREVLKVVEVTERQFTATHVCGPMPPAGSNFVCYKAEWKQEKEDEPGRWEFSKKGSAVVDTSKGRMITLRILEGEAEAGFLLARPNDKAFR